MRVNGSGTTRKFVSDPDELSAAIADAATTVEVPEPEFPYKVGWSPTYDALAGEEFEQVTPVETLLDDVKGRGRVILHGEAGSGKTTVLLRLFKKAAQEMYPVFVNLRRWKPPLFEEWKVAQGNDAYRMALLLANLAEPATDEGTIQNLPGDRFRLLFIDGLNEVPEEVARGVLSAAEEFARRNPLGGVVVSDRLTRRDLPSEKWDLARLQPLDAGQVRELVPAAAFDAADPAQTELMRRPFFLNWAIQAGPTTASSAEAIEAFLQTHGDLDDAELDAAARGAFAMYESPDKSRTFDFASFTVRAGEEVARKLVAANLLEREDEFAYFAHHLYHDYLAARWLAHDQTRWDRAAFDALSFHASSFDALALALEQVREAELADELIRRIYDWNFYASAYALGKGRHLGSVLVTEKMEVALLAMLAERRWDLIRATVEAVTDALLFVPSDLARELLAAGSLEEVQRLIQQIDAEDDEYQAWRQLFLTPIGSEAPAEGVTLLADARSLLGWTAANVLRRTELTSEQQFEVRNLVERHREPRVRWRSAHALGSHPSMENAEVLAQALTDVDEWVRYGAIRAIIEEAALSPNLRGEILRLVIEAVDQIVEDSRTIGQLQRSLVLREPPMEWPDAVAPLVEALWFKAASVEAQDRWRQVAYDVQRSVAA
jgi:hypothetical protein